jgi:hypothetical protein
MGIRLSASADEEQARGQVSVSVSSHVAAVEDDRSISTTDMLQHLGIYQSWRALDI